MNGGDEGLFITGATIVFLAQCAWWGCDDTKAIMWRVGVTLLGIAIALLGDILRR